MYFTVVDSFVYEDQFLFAGRLEDVMHDGFGNKVGNAELFAYFAFSAISTLHLIDVSAYGGVPLPRLYVFPFGTFL